jgi:hypothetical protein
VTPIDSLEDDILLLIFKSYVYGFSGTRPDRAWQLLVHVCRRWRSLVFEYPGHLGLRLVCTTRTPVKDALDIWPSLLPLTIVYERDATGNVDNIIAGLERTDRVQEVNLLDAPNSISEIILASTQPLPELRFLWVGLYNMSGIGPLFVPDSALGGSAPRLKSLLLSNVIFPGLLKLLLSTTHLVELQLVKIPHSGYIPPDTMVTALSMLTSLSHLTLKFASSRSCPDRASRRPSPSTRSVLSVLLRFQFTGVNEYLEDLVACIDAPQLSDLYITFFNDTVFDIPQFIQFTGRTPLSRALEKAHITFWDRGTNVSFSSQTSDYEFGPFRVGILCEELDGQVSSMEQVCTSCLLLSSKLEDLYIHEDPYKHRVWKDNFEDGLWLELLQPFNAVKNLYLSEQFATHIAPALQELVGDRTTEVLPALQDIFLEGLESWGPLQEGIRQLVAARQVASRPIAVSCWVNSEKEKKDY